MTQNIANVTADGDSAAVQVTAGQYLIAVGGSFGGGTVQVKVNVGNAVGVPITGAAYTAAAAEVIWLPSCTVFVTTTGSTTPDINVSVAELSTQLDD